MTTQADPGSRSLAADHQGLNQPNQTLEARVRALEAENNDLNHLLLSSEVASLLLDAELRLRRFTPASEALLVLGPEAIGQPVAALETRFDARGFAEDAQSVLAGAQPPARELAADHGRWFLQHMRPYRTSNAPSAAIAGVAVTFTDCTAAREAEQRYRATLGRLKRHLDSSPVASMEWDVKGRLLGWSPAAARIFGWTEQVVLGRTFDDIGLIDPADREHMRQVSAALFRGEFEHHRTPVRNRRADGSLVWCEWYNSALHDPDGHLVSVLSLVVDVSERQALEENLRQTTARLAEADRRKNAFLALLGHELRNPLVPVRSTLECLALDPPDTATYARACQRIDRQIGHLERIIHDLLDIARISRGAIVLRPAAQDAVALVHEALETVAAPLAERQHELDTALPAAPVPLWGDATRLVQVFTNLLDNAIKYTEPGGQIRLALTVGGQELCLSVADNGQGIAPEDQPWLFDAFSRGAESRVGRDNGLGIGLALVRQLVELHQGRIEAESAGVGQGATFRLWLPLADGVNLANPAEAPDVPAVPTTPAPHHCPPAPPARRVLLVDDDAEILDATSALLRALGHQVETVATGAAALERIRTSCPECVLLDLGLPDMDGLDLARELADWPRRPELTLVALSGYSLAEQPDAAALFDHLLLKPARRADFERVLAGMGG
ncbi:Virulence sensor protein BvgS precursor [Thiorhodovibrio winogradskyi]|uniref:histidine kinase n=1 Tax=Thiorhodovibrio winogradskyi TaxID=77007 RepID=A0ABZ0SBQ0_9GAMM|nr:ATP-binding protein [Thiorhodovibrio winogradskyi]